MPLLPQEPCVFPTQLFEEPSLERCEERAWWVLHTRPRQEKSLARALHQSGIPFYLPLIARRLNVRGRSLTSHVPLFAGYLFLLADRDEYLAALATSRVVQGLVV